MQIRPFAPALPRIAALVIGLAALALPASASAQDGPASRFLKQRHDEITRIMRRRADTEEARHQRSEEVRRIVRELFDFEVVSRRALGEHWEARTPQQRQEFLDLLRELVQRNYEANLERILDAEVRYVREEATADGAVVHTEARSRTERRAPPIAISYVMRREGSAWRIQDVVSDGLSLVRDSQVRYNRIIAQHGWDELIRRMRQRVEEGPTSARTSD
jgi:phospholipid transport system substrate-binding protein